jgi:hypothetical protein
MVKRTHRWYIKQLLQEKKDEWNILDLGCGAKSHWVQAQTYFDMQNHEEKYPGKRFVQGDIHNTPFKDKEFDFVVAAQIAEHALDPEIFINELMRIAKRGFIELPTPFCDNLVIGNHPHHPWWVTFDDIEQEIVYKPKAQILKEQIWYREYNLMLPFFYESFVTELIWEDTIEWKYGEQVFEVGGNKIDLETHSIQPWMFGEITASDLLAMANKKK